MTITQEEQGLKTGAVIVTWHPAPGAIEQLLQALTGQVDQVVIVDNSEPACNLPPAPEGLKLAVKADGQNHGVAAALNRGLDQLRASGCQRALMLDQDSLPPADMVAVLNQTLSEGQVRQPKTLAAGPAIRERGASQAAPFVRFRLPLNQRLRPESGSVACDFLITSGCLVDLALAEQVGPMREDWFIDSIDLEWSFRARRLGFGLLGSVDVELEHSIGEQRPLPLGLGHFRYHPPARLYTMMRNRIWLYRSQAPFAWVIQDFLRLLGKLALFSLIGPRRAHIGAMLRGIRDGVAKKP
ncbi:MAG: glycosyltransferase family 2 protein [Wenzhouxiangella sp.]